MEHSDQEKHFYGKAISPDREQKKIEQLMRKYRTAPVDEELKKKIWDELQMKKASGEITVPFKVVLRRDIYNKYPSYVEVIIDTKL